MSSLPMSSNHRQFPPSQVTTPIPQVQEDSWVAESRATHHMTYDLSNIGKLSVYNANDAISTASGEGLKVQHIGSSTIHTETRS